MLINTIGFKRAEAIGVRAERVLRAGERKITYYAVCENGFCVRFLKKDNPGLPLPSERDFQWREISPLYHASDTINLEAFARKKAA